MKKVIVLIPLFALFLLSACASNNHIPDGLGVTNGELAPLPDTPNAVSSQTDQPDKKVEPFPFKKDLASSKNAVLKVLKGYDGLEIISQQEQYIHAVSTSRFMKFKDDLEFYFDTKNSLVHFRSSSRVGYSDLGVNRERYNQLKEMYSSQ